jgi:hypothetical protein
MEWFKTRNNLFDEDTLKESLKAVVDSIRLKYDAWKIDEMAKGLDMQFFVYVLYNCEWNITNILWGFRQYNMNLKNT